MPVRKVLLVIASLATAVGALALTEGVAAADAAPIVVRTLPVERPGSTYATAEFTLDHLPLTADYECIDPDDDLVSCVGDVPHGATMPAAIGTNSFTVTATDAAGHVTVETRTYVVRSLRSECQATAARIAGIAYAPVNGGSPCTINPPAAEAQYATLGDVRWVGGLLSPLLGALAPKVEVQGGYAMVSRGHRAEAAVGQVRIEPKTLVRSITINGLRSGIFWMDGPGACGYTQAASSIGEILIEPLVGEPTGSRAIDGPMTIPLGIGAIHLNQTVITGSVITQRAFFLDLPGTALDVVLGEVKAGYTCVA